jgi:hypothetical protein
MLFHLKFDQESNTNGVGDFLNFPTVFTSPHPINGLGDLTFCKTMGLLKLYSGQIAAAKEKWNLRLFGQKSSPQLNIKNLENSPSFLSITHTTLSAKRLRSYGIWKIDFAAEFCFWIEQQLNGNQLLGLGLAKTTEVPQTITLGKSLSFPMVHQTAPKGWQFTSYGCQKLDWFAESEVLDRLHLSD